MQQVLVLNASYEPLNVCSDRRAHVLVWKGKAEVIEKLNMPPSFVILDRVVWGVSALLGKLDDLSPEFARKEAQDVAGELKIDFEDDVPGAGFVAATAAA